MILFCNNKKYMWCGLAVKRQIRQFGRKYRIYLTLLAHLRMTSVAPACRPGCCGLNRKVLYFIAKYA